MARKLGLTLADVVTSATRIADRDGLDRLTLAAVAEDLGVRSPSLYAHVDGMAGLRRALQIHAAAEMEGRFRGATAGRSGAGPLRAVAHEYRRFTHDHPGLYDALLPAPKPGEDDEVYAALAAPALIVAEAVTAAGVAPDRAIPVVRALRSAVHGFVTLEKSGGFGMPEDIDESFTVLVDLMVDAITADNERNTE